MFQPNKSCKDCCYDASCAEQTKGAMTIFNRIRNALRKGTENKEEGV
ncbi:MAG: hypothetical protein WC343_05770 [Bacilli bacterium]|jgi:hypothetical protein